MPASSLLLPLLPLAAALPVFAGQDGQQQAAQTDILAIRKDQWSRLTVPVQVVEFPRLALVLDALKAGQVDSFVPFDPSGTVVAMGA